MGQAVASASSSSSRPVPAGLYGILEPKGIQVIPFHAQGVGDRIMDEMIGDGLFRAALDLVPAGLSEAIFGGNGPRALTGWTRRWRAAYP